MLPYVSYISKHLFLILFLSTLAFCSSDQDRPRISMLHVPRLAAAGDSVLLQCHYELGNEMLYSVKWYKGLYEFFRYTPNSKPSLMYFPVTGVRVDMSRSDENTVFLRDLNVDSSGNYMCEVSTEAPYFRILKATKHMEVLVPPSDGPKLLEKNSDYKTGDIRIQCISGKSNPAPHLKLYVNDMLVHTKPADEDIVVHPDKLETSSLALTLTPDFFYKGKVTVKCMATWNHINSFAIKEFRAHGDRRRGKVREQEKKRRYRLKNNAERKRTFSENEEKDYKTQHRITGKANSGLASTTFVFGMAILSIIYFIFRDSMLFLKTETQE